MPADNPDRAADPDRARAARPSTYSVDASHGKLWILTNDDHVNFRLAEAEPGAARRMAHGRSPDRTQVYLRGVTAFRDHLVITERVNGLDQMRLRSYDGSERRIPFAEASYTVGLGNNPEYAPAAYRLSYSSMVTPPTVYDYHPAENRLETLKVQRIPSGYDPSQYVDRADHGADARRAADPGLDRLPARLRAQRPGPALPLRLWRLRHRHAARLQHQPHLACSTAATPSPSPISAAATTWAINGISTASSTGGPTPSTTSSTPPAA